MPGRNEVDKYDMVRMLKLHLQLIIHYLSYAINMTITKNIDT